MNKFVLKYGVPVTVTKYTPDIVTSNTVAIVGRSMKSQANLILLENVKEGIFQMEFDVDSGYVVLDSKLNDTYVVSGMHKDATNQRYPTKVCALMQCNSTLSIKSQGLVADERGNLKNGFTDTFSNVPCYLDQIKAELRQYDAGILPETEYRGYLPALPIKETDQVTITVRGHDEQFKVLSKDYLTYPNMVVLQLRRDVRK
jgi:hypothetical protein